MEKGLEAGKSARRADSPDYFLTKYPAEEIPESIDRLLERLFSSGSWRIGQVLVSGHELRHIDDASLSALVTYARPEDAREVAMHDDEGKFRPLKSAPNLRHGWRMELMHLGEVRLALDFLYPAAIGTWLSFLRGELRSVPLRQTLARQSGMYRVVSRITDSQVESVCGSRCCHATGCLRTILWPISPGSPHALTSDPALLQGAFPAHEIPILCAEACNLLIAAGRAMVKAPKE